MKRTTPLARTGFKRKVPGVFKAQLDRTTQTLMRKVAIKRKPRKPKSGDDKRMRDACRDEPCYLRIPGVCTSDPRKSAPAHRNEGKGMGLKTADYFTVPACPTCHYEYDQGKRFLRDHKRSLWNMAFARWEPMRATKMGLESQEAA
ncbi:nuclease domain-containing protein [Paraburkholderia tuberum]|uniref:DUF1364 family protein n=1 Tax=Paraburkholderia tuberum TaxID=157910 RepID=A0A1H1JT83_9BURK|nr:nuclease domain-containing protein [Paraburkholderia tuberum]SDR52825.1 Protein of unknown function [Paraburkholderia tuberum]